MEKGDTEGGDEFENLILENGASDTNMSNTETRSAGVPNIPKLVDFEDTFRDPDDDASILHKVPQVVKRHFAKCNPKKSLLGLFPIITTLRYYNIKEDLPNDMIAGLTAGVMMIPQGMAFAALSTLPPIVGLYISFFASVTYALFGTGRQLSWGCIAILSLMIATILDKYDSSLTGGQTLNCVNGTADETLLFYTVGAVVNHTTPSSLSLVINTTSSTRGHSGFSTDEFTAEQMAKRMEVASGVSVVAGLVMVVASQIGLSKITNIMSNSLITGFTVGVSFHVATSQFKGIFGLSVPRFKGPGSVVRTWIDILVKLPETNLVTLLISVICMIIIYVVKKFINEKYKKKMRIPIPIELFVVIIATLASTYGEFNDNFNVKVVEDVPIGLPAPKFPDLTLVTDYIMDGIVIIVVAYAQSLAMAKTMGLKHNYRVDANQEMLSTGVCSVVCGLFSGYITGGSVSRSVVQDGAGGRTQVASIFAATMVLLVIMVIGPYFYYLPTCVLSSIIIINLRTMFLKLLDIPAEWRKSRYDCTVWVFTFVATVVLNADIGLLAGVGFSLFLIVLRSMLTPIVEVGQIQTGANASELRSLRDYSSANRINNVCIIKITSALYFINAEIFTSKVFLKTGIDPIALKKKKSKKAVEGSNKTNNGEVTTDTDEVKVVILDASEVSFIDVQGIQALQFIISEFESVDRQVLVAAVPETCLAMLRSTGFWKKNADRLYLTVNCALATLKQKPSTTQL